jgi:hypothetical protein
MGQSSVMASDGVKEPKMKDGNKESAKEVLSKFRSLFAICISGTFFVTTVVTRLPLEKYNTDLYSIGFVCSTLSSLCMIYLFLLIVQNLRDENDDMINIPDVKIIRYIFLGLFVFAFVAWIIFFLLMERN